MERLCAQKCKTYRREPAEVPKTASIDFAPPEDCMLSPNLLTLLAPPEISDLSHAGQPIGHIATKSGGQGQHCHKCHRFMWLVMQLWHMMWLNAEVPTKLTAAKPVLRIPAMETPRCLAAWRLGKLRTERARRAPEPRPDTRDAGAENPTAGLVCGPLKDDRHGNPTNIPRRPDAGLP
ncbi:predicted protein [Verticillium alfalfae VaMs.102]|uniref:Predicted protein n=1 Tax=Verticillium alfalfae (strain VaMs.102 / ATCC MYA-4576 / FGSC 10136) TaxID=526221 RepID=C9SJR0_VERA1|nr:predicted protein [Verticillium alfalfae VaMs.102]EEY19674.1 predicted protein [Verticillium alfalfae VaMs.102]